MYVIIGNNNVVIGIASELNRQTNGNVICEGYIVSNSLIKEVAEVETIPDGVAPFAWAYDGEFTLLPTEPTNEATEADYIASLEELGVTFDE